MEGKATVDYWKDAKLGDLVWRIAGNENVYNGDKYMGRGRWYLEPVTKISRKYVTVGEGHDFEKVSGRPRSVNGYSPPDYAFGEVEKFIQSEGPKIRRAVEHCRDARLLKAIGELMGMAQPPSL